MILDSHDRFEPVGRDSSCNGWGYKLRSGYFANCTGFHPGHISYNKTGEWVKITIDRTKGDLYFDDVQYVRGNPNLANYGPDNIYFAVTLKNLYDAI